MHAFAWQVGENALQSFCGPASWEGRSRLAHVGEARIETDLNPPIRVAEVVASPTWARRGLKQAR
jgi:hypothetical protein